MVTPGKGTDAAPPAFQEAVAGLFAAQLRAGSEIGDLPAPTRLAPWSHAISITVRDDADDEVASGRIVLLHDPHGVEAWEGTLRIVVFGTCEVDTDMATDPLLAEVAWSWLTERLATHHAGHLALGGTVTTTSSTRFGDIVGPTQAEELELRASWTATDTATAAHLEAFADFLATAAGLPPDGVSPIRAPRHSLVGERTP